MARRKKLKLIEDCRQKASDIQDGVAEFPQSLEPGDFDPMIDSLYRAADVLELTLKSLALDPGDDEELGRIRNLNAYRTAKRLWERASDGRAYQG